MYRASTAVEILLELLTQLLNQLTMVKLLRGICMCICRSADFGVVNSSFISCSLVLHLYTFSFSRYRLPSMHKPDSFLFFKLLEFQLSCLYYTLYLSLLLVFLHAFTPFFAFCFLRFSQFSTEKVILSFCGKGQGSRPPRLPLIFHPTSNLVLSFFMPCLFIHPSFDPYLLIFMVCYHIIKDTCSTEALGRSPFLPAVQGEKEVTLLIVVAELQELISTFHVRTSSLHVLFGKCFNTLLIEVSEQQ